MRKCTKEKTQYDIDMENREDKEYDKGVKIFLCLLSVIGWTLFSPLFLLVLWSHDFDLRETLLSRNVTFGPMLLFALLITFVYTVALIIGLKLSDPNIR